MPCINISSLSDRKKQILQKVLEYNQPLTFDMLQMILRNAENPNIRSLSQALSQMQTE